MLTNQEERITKLIAVGFSDKEAADALHVSTRTIVNHKANIFEKLQINKATELTAWYWTRKFNEKMSLSELKKNAIVGLFVLIILPSAFSFETLYRYRRPTRRVGTELKLVV